MKKNFASSYPVSGIRFPKFLLFLFLLLSGIRYPVSEISSANVVVDAQGNVLNQTPTDFPAGKLQVNGVDVIGGAGGGGGSVLGVSATVPVVSSGGVSPIISILAATTSVAGSMSAADKVKLNAISGTNTGDQDLSGLVPNTRTVNGHPLSANVDVTPTDLGLVIGEHVQAYNSNLTTWGDIAPTAGISTFLTAPTSANLLAALTTKTGTGSAVFHTSPTFVTPVLGVAAATSVSISGAVPYDATTWNSNLTAPTRDELRDKIESIAVATDSIFNNKGDIPVGIAADSAAVLPVGANDTIAIADSAQTTGIRWGVPASIRTALALDNVNNTSDANKPVSTAQQAALDLKVPNTRTVNGHALSANIDVTPTDLGLVIGNHVQAYDPDLTTWGAIEPAGGIGAFLAAPTSANLLAALTNETGTGSAVFHISPAFVTPVLGVAAATSVSISSAVPYDASTWNGSLTAPTRDELRDKIESIVVGSGDVATDSIFNTKGDIPVGIAADTAAVLPVGANDTIAIADSTQTTGIRWGIPASIRTALALDNVNNTSDANKPVSTAQQTALDLKVPNTRTVNGHPLSANVTVTQADLALVPGTNIVAWDADTDAIAALAGGGFPVRTATNAWAMRALAAGSPKITITNPSGIAGNPTIDLGAVAFSDLSGTVTAAQMPALTGAVTTTAGSVVTTLAANVVTNAKLALMDNGTLKGFYSSLSEEPGTPQDLTAPEVKAVLGYLSPADNGSQLTNLTATNLVGNIPVTNLAGGTNASATTYWRGDNQWFTPAGTGDALMAQPLSQFAATTSAQLAGVITNETGDGVLVFNNSPTFINPILGAATATSINGTAIPSSVTLARIDAGQTFSGDEIFTGSVTIAPVSGQAMLFAKPFSTADFAQIGLKDPAGVVVGSFNYIGSTYSDVTRRSHTEIVTPGGTSLYFRIGDTGNNITFAPSGNIAATTFNGNVFTTGTGTLTVKAGKTFTADNTLTLSGTDSSTLNVGTGGTLGTAAYTASSAYQASDGDLTTWAGVTPGSGIATFLATPTSANLLAALTNETGTGAAVFNTSPSLVTPTMTTPVVSTATASSFARFDASKNLVSAVEGVDHISVTGTPTAGQVPVASSATAAQWSNQSFTAISGSLQDAQMPALTGDVTSSAGSVATTITNNAITNAKIAEMPANTIKGNNTGGSSDTTDLTVADTKALLAYTEADLSTSDVTTNNVTSTKHGLAPKSPADATQFLNGAATPVFAAVKDSDLSTTDITTNNVSTTKHGFAPKAPNNAAHFLNGTGVYSALPAHSGGVIGTAKIRWVDPDLQVSTPTGVLTAGTTAVRDTEGVYTITPIGALPGDSREYVVVVTPISSFNFCQVLNADLTFTIALADVTGAFSDPAGGIQISIQTLSQ